MTTINKTQTDFLGNEYSYDKNNQINSISTDFNRQIDSAKSVNNSSIQNVLASLSTDYSSNSNIKPTDISFDDYKKLTYKALETIFNGDSEKIGTASGLLGTAKLTNDDILNKIYFDNKSESIKNNTSDKYFQTLGMIAIMNFKIDENNDAFLPNDPTSLSKIGQSNKSNTTSQESLFTTKNKLFSDFDKFKDYYENSKDNWTSNVDMNEIFKNMDEIKTLYTQKVEENNAILNSYTKNTKKQIF